MNKEETRNKILQNYWDCIPDDPNNAVTYEALEALWEMDRRGVRRTLQELGAWDNGDAFVLIRSSTRAGFYKTDCTKDILRYRRECINKASAILNSLSKIDRVLNQFTKNNTDLTSETNTIF